MALLLSLFTTTPSFAQGNSTDAVANDAAPETAITAFKELFQPTNVGNLHIHAPQTDNITPDYRYYGAEIPRGLFGTFADNWRDELPKTFKAYAVYEIRHNGNEDAYIMRFAGEGTQNMIGLFKMENNKVRLLKTLAVYSCSAGTCWQMDTWIRDADRDMRLDLLQKARYVQNDFVEDFTNEYTQALRQSPDGSYYRTKSFNIDWDTYFFEE